MAALHFLESLHVVRPYALGGSSSGELLETSLRRVHEALEALEALQGLVKVAAVYQIFGLHSLQTRFVLRVKNPPHARPINNPKSVLYAEILPVPNSRSQRHL